MKKHALTNIFLIISVGIFLFGTGYKLGEYRGTNAIPSAVNFNSSRQSTELSNTSSSSNSVKDIDFSLFWDTWNKLQERYVDKKKVDPKKMFYGAIKGMVASVEDPYTFFLTPEENQESKDDLSGKFEGIGAQLGLKDNKITIIAPLKQSPAEKAGVKSGDIITKVNGVSTKGWTLQQAVSKIRGKKGTKVTLTLTRGSKDVDLSITRDEIHVDSIELSYEKTQLDESKSVANLDQIGYLKLHQFGENTNSEWDKATREIESKWERKEIKGMVLDLRDNPGGYLDSAVYLASEFLPMGKVVVKQESSVGENREYKVVRKGRLLDIPLVVIINKGSASASEILAGSLRDYTRAKLVGEKSFGKGSVQEALDLKDGAGLHVTIAKWILPNGDWINSKGIEPEIKVENQLKEGETMTKDQDKQLEKAIELLIK